MSPEITIIGSGFAAQQLVKNLRKRDASATIRIITADGGDEYNKPDLSHVASRSCSADELIRLRGAAFAEQQRITLQAHCRVFGIDAARRILHTEQGEQPYRQLVLATGAQAMRPAIPGAHWLVTLNSQQEYARAERSLTQARRVMVAGGGLIGCELAMDLASAGKSVTLVEQAESLLSSLIPAMMAQPLREALSQQGVDIRLGRKLQALKPTAHGFQATLDDGRQSEQDIVIAAMGLIPETVLARSAGLEVGRGIRCDASLRTSASDIYALGDNMEWNGRLLPFLQPIVLGAGALATTLLGQPAALTLPPMLIKVKTPHYPLQLAGRTRGDDINWQCEWSAQGMTARAFDPANRLCGFVVGGDATNKAFPLLRELPH